MHCFKSSWTRRKQDAAVEAGYDFAVALGVDELPQFVDSQMDIFKDLNLSATAMERVRNLVISDIAAARKRAGR
jgi:hypothetical protein